MEQLLSGPVAGLQREASGAFFFPTRARSTCSGDAATESSSMTFEDAEEQQQNSRRITLCKQVLLEATAKYNSAPRVDMTLMKDAACRNSGALGPLLSMLAAGHDASSMVRCLDTLSFLLLDRTNRRACHELGGLDVLLDILHRAADQQVLLSGLETLCCLCKHDPKDKMALWQHKKKGVLLSMLNSRHGSTIVVEALHTCRILCFAALNNNHSTHSCIANSAAAPPSLYSTAAGPAACNQHRHCSGTPPQQPSLQRSGAAAVAAAAASTYAPKLTVARPDHTPHQHLGSLQLLEPGLLTVASGLLHPAADTAVLMKALKLLNAASAVAVSTGTATAAINPAAGSGGRSSHGGGGVSTSSAAGAGAGASGLVSGGGGGGCCGSWRTPVFQLVPLLTHCSDLEVVESALEVLVNLSEHSAFHWLLDASGCIPPLLHLLSHKRCSISRSASCVLSVLAEGGVSRVKLCQDTALLAMLRVLQTNHCSLVTIGVLYMLGRLASFRSAVVRGLRGWGAVPLLNHLLATTRDEDAADGCRQLLNVLGVPPPLPLLQPQQPAVAKAAGGPALPTKINLPNAQSSISVFGGCGRSGSGGSPDSVVVSPMGTITGTAAGPGGALVRTISAAETLTTEVAAASVRGAATAASVSGMAVAGGGRSGAATATPTAVSVAARGGGAAMENSSSCDLGTVTAALLAPATAAAARSRQPNSFRLYYAGPGVGGGMAAVTVTCGALLGTISAAAAAAY